MTQPQPAEACTELGHTEPKTHSWRPVFYLAVAVMFAVFGGLGAVAFNTH